jgi:PhnB protein
MSNNPGNDEAAIRSVIESWAKAIREKDANLVVSHFTRDSVRFDLAPPLQTTQPLKENLEDWFATFRGPIHYEIRDLTITASRQLAFCHSLNRIRGTKQDGSEPDIWFRETFCLRKLNDGWLIAHAHESVPFYMDPPFKAAIDLKP